MWSPVECLEAGQEYDFLTLVPLTVTWHRPLCLTLGLCQGLFCCPAIRTGVVLISVKGRAFRVCWKRKVDSFIVLWFLALRCTNYIGQLRKFEPMLSAFVSLRDLTKALVSELDLRPLGFHLWRICFWVHSSVSSSPPPSLSLVDCSGAVWGCFIIQLQRGWIWRREFKY